ncbi:MAG TPA: UDP-N-acetylmuramoyl-L-alanine--D-glutamate ligase [Clostridiaceae bacterium]
MEKDFEDFKAFIKGKKVGVIGIGISNRPLIDFLLKLKAKVTAFDKMDELSLGSIIKDLEDKGVSVNLGEDYLTKLTGFDVIFKTPSMRLDNPFLLKAKEEGAYITSEMEEFVKYCKGKIYGITGSDGKTTTTTIIYNMLKEEGYKTFVGGNIGTPLFSRIEEISEEDKVVLELSSFQLMSMNEPIEVALITNLSPNHLDIHRDMEEYITSKKNIFKAQDKTGILVLNEDNDITRAMKSEAKGSVISFSVKSIIQEGAYLAEGVLYLKGKKICDREEVLLIGLHNIENLLAAFCSVSEEVSIKTMRKVSLEMTGVEHRIEFVRKLKGVKYYNDSIGTSPTRTLAGLSSFDTQVILIAGGYDKKLPFQVLAENGIDKIKVLILTGTTKEKIKEAFLEVCSRRGINLAIYIVDNLGEAILKAKELAIDGDTVVLSPACASFDAYPNFEVRGNCFKELVMELK